MRLRSLLLNRRTFAWSVLGTLLIGTGWTLHAWLPPEPRWVVPGEFYPLGFSSDGTMFHATAVGRSESRSDGPIHYVDVATGHIVRSLLPDAWNVDSPVFSDDGKRLALLCADPAARSGTQLFVVDIEAGTERRVEIPATTTMWLLHFSPDGDLLLLEEIDLPRKGSDGTPEVMRLILHDAASLTRIAERRALKDCWQWSADGHALVVYVADDGGKATLRRIRKDGEETTALDGAGNCLMMTRDGRLLLTTGPLDQPGAGRVVRCWDVESGACRAEIPRHAMSNFGRYYPGVAVLADGQTLLIEQQPPDGDAVLIVWHLQENRAIASVPLEDRQILVSGNRSVFALHREAGPDQVVLYSGHGMRMWQRDWPGEILHRIDFIPGDPVVVTATGTGMRNLTPATRLQCLDMATGAVRFEPALPPTANAQDWLAEGQSLALIQPVARDASNGLYAKFVEPLLERLTGRGAGVTLWRTRIFDVTAAEETFRVDDRTVHTRLFLAPDGGSVVLYDAPGNLTCYDVPGRTPWIRVVGIPAALGLLLLGAAAARRRWRRRLSRSQPAADGNRSQTPAGP
jgi:hypothetical protein